jgi:prevent-host-death family protein
MLEIAMRISIADAEGQLTDLVRLASEGQEIVLTVNGRETVRLEPVHRLDGSTEKVTTFIEDPVARDKFIQELQEEIRRKNLPPGPDAARSQDFLYDDETGLPA